MQQSDITLVNHNKDGNNNNISFWSYVPIRNLVVDFEDMNDINEEQVLLCYKYELPKNRVRQSSIGIEQYDSPTNK